MKYENVSEAIFLERLSRFTARVQINNREEIVHVKNTGRLAELFVKGTPVFLELSANPNRKTKYSLVSLKNENGFVNVDSQAPNKIVLESFDKIIKNPLLIKPEAKYNNSRLDFYAETKTKKIYLETKGVTLKAGTKAVFPDAPTLRGLRHVEELIEIKKSGFDAYIVFIIKISGTTELVPNYENQPEFGKALSLAKSEGVQILAYDCIVKPDEISLGKKIPVALL